MAQKGGDITTKFKVDISDLKAGVSEANKQIKLANAEFKAASAGMDDWAKSSDGLNAKLKQLGSVLQSENKKLNNYKDQLEKIEEAEQENGKRADELKKKLQQLSSQGVSKTSDEYKKYEKALNDVEKEQLANQNAADKLKITVLNQQAAVNKTEKELNKYEKTLTELNGSNNKVKNSFEKLEDTISDQEKRLTDLKSEYTNIVLEQGKNSKEAKTLAKSMSTLNKELEDSKSSMTKAENASEKLTSSLKNTKEAANESDGGFTILKGTLANLTANVISSAISKIGELATSLFDMVEATEEYRSMMAKLEGATNNYGYQIDYTKDKFEEFYRYLGDSQMANNAISNLMGLQVETGTLDKLINGAISTWSMYGDSIPIESLTESINETIQVGKVTGTFADTLNWTKINQEELSTSLGNGSAAQAAFNKAISEGEAVEDAFSAALAATSDQGERANIVANFLNSTYGESKTTYDELNGAMLDANQSELNLIDSQAKLAEAVSPVKDVFTQLKTQALEAILPIVSDLAQKFLDLKDYLNEHPAVLTVVTTAVSALAAAFGVLAGALAIQGLIKGVTAAIGLLNTTLLANPITLVIAAIAALVAGFVALWNKSEAFRNFWIGLWEGIKSACEPVIDSMVNAFKEAWELIKVVWDAVKPYFELLWNNIKVVFSVVKDVLSGYFKLAWTAIKAVWDTVTSYFKAIWDTIAGIFRVVKDVLTGNWKDAWEGIKGIVNTWADYFKTKWENIKKVFSGVKDFFKNSFQSAWGAVKQVFANWGSFFSGLWNKIKNTFSGLGTKIGNAIGGAVKTAINGVISYIENTINKAIGLINGAIGVINKLPGVSVSKISELNLPRLERGIGIAKKGHQYLLEGNGNEAVVPLDKNKYWIKAVADDMRKELQGGVASTTSNLATNNVNNFTQVINAPKTPSRIELYRDTKNLLALKGGV